MRTTLWLSALALVLAACGTGQDAGGEGSLGSTSLPTDGATTTTADGSGPATTTTSAGAAPTTSSTGTPLPPLDGPPAPDFSLQLSDGSTFVLSEEVRPVYMVFWAEW